jgi:pSer/pThr/pTyr-binding forkhead associated (FHA) protein
MDASAHTAYRLTGVVRIGRAPENTIVITDPTVSRIHAEVWLQDGRLLLRSLGSNGTRVNGDRVPGTWELAEGDTIDVGWTSFVFTTRPLPLGVHPASRGMAAVTRKPATTTSVVAVTDTGSREERQLEDTRPNEVVEERQPGRLLLGIAVVLGVLAALALALKP